MGYLTTEDMLAFFPERELIQLTNLDDATQSTVDTVRLSQATARAAEEADSYLGVRFSLPLWETTDEVPMVLKSKVADIARYILDLYHTRDDVTTRHKDAIAWLSRVAKGQVTLGLDAQDKPTDTTKRIRISTLDQVFTSEAFQGF